MNRPMSVLLVLAALLSSASAMAQGTLDRIRERGELRIGYRTDARPLSFEENGAPAGYSVDLCKRVAAGIGGQLNLPAMKATYVKVTTENRFDALVNSLEIGKPPRGGGSGGAGGGTHGGGRRPRHLH